MATTKTATTKTNDADTDEFTAEERAAMKQRSAELRKKRRGKTTPEEDAAEVLEAIAAMEEPDRGIAESIHAIITATAPELAPKTWYGFPAYFAAGKCVAFYQPATKFKYRYGTLGFQENAQLDDGQMWATSFAILEITPDVEKRIAELVRRAAGS
ncbi:hypothetical protein ABCS02_20150 [Microbacterium sp. X-17]|uniref:iron chaperone n=1 Tax=Microbacterium sp. X-17 TaxID=3144404 RepID=UPI0031F48193